MLDVRELTAEAFAPSGQVIAPLRTGGQGSETSHSLVVGADPFLRSQGDQLVALARRDAVRRSTEQRERSRSAVPPLRR
jgi:hypothetical protein